MNIEYAIAFKSDSCVCCGNMPIVIDGYKCLGKARLKKSQLIRAGFYDVNIVPYDLEIMIPEGIEWDYVYKNKID